YSTPAALRQIADTPGSLADVQNAAGTRMPKFYCDVPGCNHEFYRAKNFKSHMVKHTSARPFACQICKERLKRRGDMLRHIRVIHGRQPVIHCPFCGTACAGVRGCRDHVHERHGEIEIDAQAGGCGPDAFVRVLDTVIEFKKRPGRGGNVAQSRDVDGDGFAES
ncbi:MAG: hypothetical protein SGCHY_001947, partial [Lobulomycetales sp.]